MMSSSLIYLIILWLSHSSHIVNTSYSSLYVGNIPQCIDGSLHLHGFTISTGSSKPEYDTNVFICYRITSIFDPAPYSLLIEYRMNDQMPSSPFSECNEKLYEYDAVEFFITPYIYDQQTPASYVEIELNPNTGNGALFLSTIENKCDNCSCIQGTPIQCDNKGIIDYNATVIQKTDKSYSWSAYIEITFAFIHQFADLSSDQIDDDDIGNVYRINFFRIDDLNMNGNNITQYSCWNATLLTPPCFHVPSSFGYFQLV